MPRITEPTVAEHRAKQRAAVLQAAEDLAVERGGAAVTVAAVAARTGLARPSVYAYFSSAEDMLVALVREGFERWHAALQDAVGDGASPEDVVRGYLSAAASRAARGEHRLAAALSGVPLPPPVREELLVRHREMAAPLATAARSLGLPADADAEPVIALLMAVVNHCITRVEAGHSPTDEARIAGDVLLGGLRGLAAAGR